MWKSFRFQKQPQKTFQTASKTMISQQQAWEHPQVDQKRQRNFWQKCPLILEWHFATAVYLNLAKDGILVLDVENGNIMEINSYLIDMLGYAKDKLIEKAILEVGFFKNIIHNKDKFLKLQQTKFVQYEDLPLETGDERKINIEFISKVFSVENNKVIQCFIREISDKKVEKSLSPHNRKNQ